MSGLERFPHTEKQSVCSGTLLKLKNLTSRKNPDRFYHWQTNEALFHMRKKALRAMHSKKIIHNINWLGTIVANSMNILIGPVADATILAALALYKEAWIGQ